MGSLMAGWDSPRLSSPKVRFGKQPSFTRIEIDNYRKRKRELEEEHQKAASDLVVQMKMDNTSPVAHNDVIISIEKDLQTLENYKDWWTKSTWAFLNEERRDAEAFNKISSSHK